MTAAALKKLSEAKYQKAAEQGKHEKMSELDVWPIVVENKFRDGVDDHTAHLKLIAHVKKHGSYAMQAFLFKRRQMLPGLIQAIWQWEDVDVVLEDASRSRMDTLKEAALRDCVCSGQWLAFVTGTFIKNKIPVQELCKDIYSAFENGRSEVTPVVVLAGASGGEGKSVFLKPLQVLFGDECLSHSDSLPQGV